MQIYTHTYVETQPHTRDFEWRRSHTASLLQVDYDPKAPVGPCVKTAAQQAVAPSALIAIYTATQNTQATCSVRLFCHRPRHELSTDTNTPHSPQPNTDRALRSHRTHAAGRSNRVWQVRQHRVFGARFLVSATSNTRSNHRCESPEPGLRAVRLFHIDRHRPATQTPLRPRVHRNDRRDRSGLRIAPDTPRPKPPACPKALPIVVEGT